MPEGYRISSFLLVCQLCAVNQPLGDDLHSLPLREDSALPGESPNIPIMSVFKKLGTTSSAETLIQPRDIFTVLPAKAKKYQYPRDVQTEVWSAWVPRRNEPDVVIKMNTGSGKTVVGLVILKSCLNEGVGPAVYIAPDIYLTNQVISEAKALGIEVTTDVESPRFLRNQAILVANIKKLVNGMSVFGVRDEGVLIPIGSLLVDDAHACLATTEEQFTLRAPSSAEIYGKMLELFADDLRQQSSAGFLEIQAGDPNKNLLIPFWAWQAKHEEVAAILHEAKTTQDVQFSWPLLSEILPLCECVIGGSGLEISSRCAPIDAIPSFGSAKRRIFMTATLADDTVLVTTFDADPKAALTPITPSNASDVGDRLILIPQELNTELSDDDLKSLLVGLAERHNVVVIVPSFYRAKFWEDVAEKTLEAKTLEAGVAELREGHIGLVVIVNKYDGIDLPDDSCRILVLDGLPNVSGRLDRIDEAVLHGTKEQNARAIQRIEQGMGRGVRSIDDWCAVILMGPSLTRALYVEDAIEHLTPATRSQYTLSLTLAEHIRKSGIGEIAKVIEDFLARDPDWVKASKGNLVHVGYDQEGILNPIGLAQRETFKELQVRDFQRADQVMQKTVDTTSDPRTRGWLKQQLAEVRNHLNPVDAQVLLRSAIADNRLVVRPMDGVSYERLNPDRRTQALRAVEFIVGLRLTQNQFTIYVNGLLDDLRFIPRTSNKFEFAWAQLGKLLGFETQRPEQEYGSGPDVLWSLGGLKFLVCECKNGATNGRIVKSDCDQLSGSMHWFSQKYDSSCNAIPVMIHPNNVVAEDGSPADGMRVIDVDGLTKLKKAIAALPRLFLKEKYPPVESVMLQYLEHHRVTAGSFLQNYTSAFKRR